MITKTQAVKQAALTLYQRDEELVALDRAAVLGLPAQVRQRWFYLLQVIHPELERVTADMMELLQPDNEVKIISVIGMTGIGKTTLANCVLQLLMNRIQSKVESHHRPFVYVNVASNGEQSLSWKTLYRKMLTEGGEVEIDIKRGYTVENGKLYSPRSRGPGLAQLRELVELMLKRREVKVLVLDEAMHLLRFQDYASVMDTLKSLADAHDTKLLLLGPYQLAELVTQYGQVARRGEIVHYQRYKTSIKPGKRPTKDEAGYFEALRKLQAHWPCEQVPDFMAIGHELMRATLGSVGLLKSTLLTFCALQMADAQEKFQPGFFEKALKSGKALEVIEKETRAGEVKLVGACYGDGVARDADGISWLQKLVAVPHV
ncbi:ATP-binding protein [Ideonella azotifigens]|uniref:AAA+ ATPase domain-containing protein n=1 Tax=Ideonella azotifigens TaxID=513160 RepID=A0ABN1K260_9BURK|nr:ATP-binding protein [Ideonella azotifigens]MCD2343777.1 ATP-binding protein [Ideonella azotifigens]